MSVRPFVEGSRDGENSSRSDAQIGFQRVSRVYCRYPTGLSDSGIADGYAGVAVVSWENSPKCSTPCRLHAVFRAAETRCLRFDEYDCIRLRAVDEGEYGGYERRSRQLKTVTTLREIDFEWLYR